MSEVVVVIDAADEVIAAAEEIVRNAATKITAVPAGGTISFPEIPGWAAWTITLGYFLGTVPTRPEGAPQSAIEQYEDLAHDLRQQTDYLQTHDLTPEQARLQVEGIRLNTGFLRQMTRALAAAAASAGAGASPGLETMPSPSAVNQAQGAQLANALARVTVWQRAHHGQVHGNLVQAQGRANAAAAALGLATATQAGATVDAVRAVVDVILPRAVTELTTTIRELRQAQQAANAELERALERTADRLVTRIGDLTRWLVTTALPDLEEQIKAERAARKDADHELRRGIATEADVRADADLGLQTAVAPLVAWASSFGVHTTEKVRRLENPLDQLLNADWSLVLGFASFPALVALIGKLLPHVAGATPAVLGGLEGAASRALGEL